MLILSQNMNAAGDFGLLPFEGEINAVEGAAVHMQRPEVRSLRFLTSHILSTHALSSPFR